MKITIQIYEENYLRMQIKEDPHTLFNLLRIVALDEEGVVLAGYARDRTFEESLMFQIRTENGTDPKDVLINSARKVASLANNFKDAFEKEMDY